MADAEPATRLAEQFPSEAVQVHADRLGMWFFLATEVMMFGAVFMVLAVYRYLHPSETREASAHMHVWIGTANTAILLTTSFLVTLAIAAARYGRRREAVWQLAASAALGAVFLVLKLTEWYLEYKEGLMPGVSPRFVLPEPASRLFFDLYYLSTGLHALHLLIGVTLVGAVAARIHVGNLEIPGRSAVVEIVGLYWHFVDVVWIFLFPILYLAGPR